jgi:hypothetical protein
MNSRKGLLLVVMEPPAALEEEFNDWYDTEHFPQRSALPGFETASRWTCVAGWPRWLAIYDLTSLATLESEAYRAVSGPRPTPWSQRILPRTVGRMRVVAEQIAPGDELTIASSQTARLLVARHPAIALADEEKTAKRITSAVRAWNGVIQARVFKSRRGSAIDLWLLAAFSRPVSAEALASSAGYLDGGGGADVFNLYVPYFRKQ